MIKQTLYWPKSLYILMFSQIIMISAFTIFTLRIINVKSPGYVGDVYGIMFGSVFILISSYSLIRKLIFPEMVYEAGVIRFLGQKDGAAGRQEIFVYNIASVIEKIRNYFRSCPGISPIVIED